MISAHITTADERSSIRSEPALGAPCRRLRPRMTANALLL
jgi:hypothetical protein